VKIPLLNKSDALTVLATAASIALLVGCSSNDESQATSNDLVTTPAVVFLNSEDCNDLVHGPLDTTEVTIQFGELSIPITAEVADEQSERAQGLMCRASIPSGTGMWFYYPEPRTNGFWMFNTYVPLEILYIDHSGRVVDKIATTPCLRDGLHDDDWQVKCATEAKNYVPVGEWLRVLELPAGWLESVGIADSDVDELTVRTISVAH